MLRALDELVILGVATNQGFHRRLLCDPAFVRGEVDIQFLERRSDLLEPGADSNRDLRLAIAAALLEDASQGAGTSGQAAGTGDRGPRVEDRVKADPWTEAGRLDALR
jgi:acetyl/propionyl-CoA carboxylase alpha subunit